MKHLLIASTIALTVSLPVQAHAWSWWMAFFPVATFLDMGLS